MAEHLNTADQVFHLERKYMMDILCTLGSGRGPLSRCALRCGWSLRLLLPAPISSISPSSEPSSTASSSSSSYSSSSFSAKSVSLYLTGSFRIRELLLEPGVEGAAEPGVPSIGGKTLLRFFLGVETAFLTAGPDLASTVLVLAPGGALGITVFC
jgi:hypothetical protein